MAKPAHTPDSPAAETTASPLQIVVPPNLARRIARAAPHPRSSQEPPPSLVSAVDPDRRQATAQTSGGGATRLVVAPPEIFDGANATLRERAWLAFYARATTAFAGRFDAVLFTDDAAATATLADTLDLPADVLVTHPVAPSSTIAMRMLEGLRGLADGRNGTDQALRLAQELIEVADLFAEQPATAASRETDTDLSAAGGPLAHLKALTALQERPLDCGHATFASLHSHVQASSTRAGAAPDPKRVCVYLPLADQDVAVLDDLALSLLSLARRLARDGHAVTLAHDGLDERLHAQAIRRRLQEALGDHGAHVEHVEVPSPAVENTKGLLGSTLTAPYNFLEWLKTRHFDIVHVPDGGYPGYFALMAKRQGLAFARTHFCVHVGKPVLWHKLINADPIDGPQWLARIHAERRCVEYADTLVAPTQYMLRWLLHQGYAIPRVRAFVQPLLARDDENAAQTPGAIDELVFVGAIEPGNGLPQFLDAVVRTIDGGGPVPRVTFAGAANPAFPARRFVDSKLAPTGVSWTFREDGDADAVVDYVAAGGRLAVFPMVEANGARALQACLERGLPVLASRCEGLAEMIHIDDHARATVELHPERLAERFRTILNDGIAPARPTVATRAVETGWRDWHAAPPTAGAAPAAASEEGQPLVTVCLMHFNRPNLVEQAIESVKAQTYPNLEVVLVDDGSKDPDVPALLDRLEPEFAARGWKIVRQPNLYLGAARNTAARHAAGEYLYFLDDDNVLKPEGLATFVAVAQRTGADIVTSFSDAFSASKPPEHIPPHRRVRIVQLGDDICFGLFRNGFGDSNALIRRDVFEALGGNTEDYGVGKDDQEFFARAILSGYRLEHTPQALYWARQPAVRLRHLHYSPYSGNLRVARAYRNMLPPALQNLVLMAQGQQLRMDTYGPLADPQTTARIAQQLISSPSWRLTAPLHERFNDVIDYAGESGFIGLNSAGTEHIGRPPPWVIYRVLNSLSWELTAPLRLPGHVWHLARRIVRRKLGRA